MSTSDILSIISISLSSLLTIVIFIYQIRNDIKIKRLEEKQRRKEIEEKANVFLIENEEEKVYLPYCIIAADINRQEKHIRKIYKNFCCQSKEVRAEILKQAGYELSPTLKENWLDEGFHLLKTDIEKYELGKNYLYDGEKYFHRGYEDYREVEWTLEFEQIFNPINKYRQFANICFTNGLLDINSYIEEYFRYYIDKSDVCIGKPVPPMDYVWELNKLASGETHEKVVCMWIIHTVHCICINILNRKTKGQHKLRGNVAGCIDKTLEDKYYDALLCLYYTYESEFALPKKKHRRKI